MSCLAGSKPQLSQPYARFSDKHVLCRRTCLRRISLWKQANRLVLVSASKSQSIPCRSSKWRLRRLDPEELQAVCELQAEAFFEPFPVGLLNPVLKTVFRGEVLAALQEKLKYAPEDRFKCIVAEPKATGSGIVGVVEVSLQDDKEVLRRLGGESETYAYVACMAVRPALRRQGIASALLSAAEHIAGQWDEQHLALHVYADNSQACAVYQKNGFRVLNSDPAWRRFIGSRPQLLMGKHRN